MLFVSEEALLIQTHLWAGEYGQSEEQVEALVNELATFFAERGFGNSEDDSIRSIISVGTVELPDEVEEFVDELQQYAKWIVLPPKPES